jgi:ABC-type transporter Mla subunit MlaD
MATKTSARSRATKPKAKSTKSAKPVDRVEDAISAAQDALKDLRGDLSRSRKTLVKDLDKTLKDARSSLRRMRTTLVDDLDEVGRKLGGDSAAKRKPAGSRTTKAKATKAKAKPKARAKPKAKARA